MLRDYQKELVDNVLTVFKSKFVKHAMAVLPTGGGKTLVASLISQYFKSVLWLAHRSELLDQASKALADHPDATVWSVFKEPPSRSYDLVVLDESHHAAAPTIRNFIDKINYNKLLGITATPNRLDQLYLGFDCIIYGVHFDELIKTGYLVPIDLYSIRTHTDKDLAIVKWMYQYGDKLGKTILFVSRREQASFFKSILSPVFKTEMILQDSNRKDIINAYLTDRIDILISCNILTEGVDLPCTQSIVLARHTESENLMRQMIGRGIRPFKSKDHCKLVECVPIIGTQSSVSNVITPRNHFVSSMAGEDWSISKL